jgi:hypothetical protein
MPSRLAVQADDNVSLEKQLPTTEERFITNESFVQQVFDHQRAGSAHLLPSLFA